MRNNLSQQQDLRQQQRLTPLQVQFVKMLEMTGPEIEAEVRQAVEDMPALEAAPDDAPASSSALEADDRNIAPESADELQRADYANDDETPSYILDARNRSASDPVYEPIAVNDEPTLAETLTDQLAELSLTPDQRLAADHIIGNLDSNGYLTRPLRDIADDIAFNLGVDMPLTVLEQARDIVRSLDPPGIGASDLRDCLLLQLKRRQPSPAVDLATDIIDHHFDLFSKKHFHRLAERLDVTDDQVKEAIALISKLNPKPGNQHGDTALEQSGRIIVPEFMVEPEGDSLVVTLLNSIPELTVSETFTDDTLIPPDASERRRQEAQTFIRSRRDEASSFIKTLKMRQSTLFNVMTAIASIQRDFFFTGDESKLKPMILKDVAALTGYNLSVISRATASKYVMTVAGIYPLKFFFNERPSDDDDTTYHQIAAEMRRIIDAEDKNSPTTDEAITAMLNARGFNIARRTVAKYRERMGIPVARLRRGF